MDLYEQIVIRIIKSQEDIIGPVAVEQARRVPHIKVDWSNKQIDIEGNEAHAIDALIEIYKELFGQISVEVSKEAASSLTGQLPADGLPQALK